jgi:hypothetical protein
MSPIPGPSLGNRLLNTSLNNGGIIGSSVFVWLSMRLYNKDQQDKPGSHELELGVGGYQSTVLDAATK